MVGGASDEARRQLLDCDQVVGGALNWTLRPRLLNPYQLPDLHIQGLCQPVDDIQRRIAPASLDLTDEFPAQLGLLTEALLGEKAELPNCTEASPKVHGEICGSTTHPRIVARRRADVNPR